MKRGNTGKLLYDFDVSALLEVQTEKGNWVRVTARDFRSWDGPRRITRAYPDPEDRHGYIQEEIEYHGPVFIYGTNTQVEYHGSFKPMAGERPTARKRDRV